MLIFNNTTIYFCMTYIHSYSLSEAYSQKHRKQYLHFYFFLMLTIFFIHLDASLWHTMLAPILSGQHQKVKLLVFHSYHFVCLLFWSASFVHITDIYIQENILTSLLILFYNTMPPPHPPMLAHQWYCHDHDAVFPECQFSETLYMCNLKCNLKSC